jgi:hypothetical protein
MLLDALVRLAAVLSTSGAWRFNPVGFTHGEVLPEVRVKLFYEWGLAVPSRRSHARVDDSERVGTIGRKRLGFRLTNYTHVTTSNECSEVRCRGGGEHGLLYGRRVLLLYGCPDWPHHPAFLVQIGARYWLENPSQGRAPAQRPLWGASVMIVIYPSSLISWSVAVATSGGSWRGTPWTQEQGAMDWQDTEAAVLKERRSPRAARADARSYGGGGGGGGARGSTRVYERQSTVVTPMAEIRRLKAASEADAGCVDHNGGQRGRVMH